MENRTRGGKMKGNESCTTNNNQTTQISNMEDVGIGYFRLN